MQRLLTIAVLAVIFAGGMLAGSLSTPAVRGDKLPATAQPVQYPGITPSPAYPQPAPGILAYPPVRWQIFSFYPTNPGQVVVILLDTQTGASFVLHRFNETNYSWVPLSMR